jgi:hypothetical protein
LPLTTPGTICYTEGMPILTIIFVVGGIALMLMIAIRSFRRNAERMRSVADELGFTFHGPGEEPPGAAEPTGAQRMLQSLKPWRITGMREDVAVAIYTETRGSGKSRTTYSIVEASFPRPLAFSMLVYRQSAMARFGKAVFGLQDIEVGSEQFDKAVRIKGSDPDRIARLLSGSGIQDRIMSALQASPTISVTSKAALWEKRGWGEKAEIYRQAIDLVVPIVRALKDARAFEQD